LDWAVSQSEWHIAAQNDAITDLSRPLLFLVFIFPVPYSMPLPTPSSSDSGNRRDSETPESATTLRSKHLLSLFNTETRSRDRYQHRKSFGRRWIRPPTLRGRARQWARRNSGDIPDSFPRYRLWPQVKVQAAGKPVMLASFVENGTTLRTGSDSGFGENAASKRMP
jgi:hypothetical protein